MKSFSNNKAGYPQKNKLDGKFSIYELFFTKQVCISFKFEAEHVITKLAQTLTGHPIQYHLVIVVLGKAVGLGYALAQLSDPWYICTFTYRLQVCLVLPSEKVCLVVLLKHFSLHSY